MFTNRWQNVTKKYLVFKFPVKFFAILTRFGKH